jgi:two-component system, NarL family, nitrate/nitrite response regulator NarL
MHQAMRTAVFQSACYMIERANEYTVVLADDHPIVLNALESLLKSDRRYSIIGTYANGQDALAGLRELEPNVAVLDISMPGPNGLEVLAIAEGEGLRTRIIFLTGSASDEQIVKAITLGAWGILMKDAAAGTLLECLEKVARGERWLPPALVSSAVLRETERRQDSDKLENLLTAREREIAVLVASGNSNKQIARQANISEGTVKLHLHNVYRKLRVPNRTSLAALLQRHVRPRRI